MSEGETKIEELKLNEALSSLESISKEKGGGYFFSKKPTNGSLYSIHIEELTAFDRYYLRKWVRPLDGGSIFRMNPNFPSYTF